MFNGWYWFWLVLSLGSTTGLYFLLRHKSQKTQKIVLFSILILGLVAHFTKFLYPPYSQSESRWYRDSWFINICAADIFLFPFFFCSKNERAKDYMFYVGVLTGLVSVLYPLEPMQKANQAAEWIDSVRFYFHHTMLYCVPLLMVLLGLHKLSYKRVLWVPVYFMGVLLFVMLNQILQSELGFVPLRSSDMLHINYKNTSFIWGPGKESFAKIFTAVCPKIFKTVPVGEYAGQEKFWPWFWLIVPVFLYFTPIFFAMSMIFDHKNFKNDISNLHKKIKAKIDSKKQKNCVATQSQQTKLIEIENKTIESEIDKKECIENQKDDCQEKNEILLKTEKNIRNSKKKLKKMAKKYKKAHKIVLFFESYFLRIMLLTSVAIVFVR